ncbi:MAG: glycosyltransferase family 4 protein [Pseudomonadota bacterium]
MHIWYVNHYSGGPGIATAERAFRLAQAWQDNGIGCSVIMGSFHHLMLPEADFDAPVRTNGVTYHFVKTSPYSGNGVSRLRNILDFARGLYRVASRVPDQLPKPDVIIYSCPHPHGIYAARDLARKFQAQLVFEIRDLWPLSLTELLGTSRFHPFVQVTAHAERFAFKHADVVASVLPKAWLYMVERGYGSKPFIVVPNGLSETFAEGATLQSPTALKASRILEAWRSDGRVVFVYAGALGPPNSVVEFLDAVGPGATLDDGTRVGVLVFGRGPLSQTIQEKVDAFGEGFAYCGQVPKNELRALLRRCDVGYAGLVDRPDLFKYGISPNKIMDYFTEGLPVLLPITPCGDPVSMSQGGIARSISDRVGLRSAIIELAALSSEQRRRLGERGKSYVLANHRFDDIAARYRQALQTRPQPASAYAEEIRTEEKVASYA